jgi:hypothetical protein
MADSGGHFLAASLLDKNAVVYKALNSNCHTEGVAPGIEAYACECI